MGEVRVGEDDRVPLDSSVWALVVYLDKGELKYKYVKSLAKQNIPDLAEVLCEVILKKIPYLVFIIWHGKYRTDLFLVDSEKLLNRLKEVYDLKKHFIDKIRMYEKLKNDLMKYSVNEVDLDLDREIEKLRSFLGVLYG